MSELVEVLRNKVEGTEARKQERQRRAEERERQRRVAEEWERLRLRQEDIKRERKRREKKEMENKVRASIEEALKGADKKLKEMNFQRKAKKLIEYMTYYFKYHNMVEEIEKFGLTQGLPRIEIENVKQKFLEINTREWPEPYRTRCEFTEMEKMAFSMDPESTHSS